MGGYKGYLRMNDSEQAHVKTVHHVGEIQSVVEKHIGRCCVEYFGAEANGGSRSALSRNNPSANWNRRGRPRSWKNS